MELRIGSGSFVFEICVSVGDAVIPRKLKEEEDLTWHDLYRRLSTTFPSPGSMITAIRNWREQRKYFFALYSRIDNANKGKYTKKGEFESRKAALKEYKKKH